MPGNPRRASAASLRQQHLYEKPKRLRDVPAYIGRVTKGFFARLFYIIALVWEANPAVMILLCFTCLLTGVLPLVGAVISRDLLNAVNEVMISHGVNIGQDLFGSLTGVLSGVAFLLILQLLYRLLNHVMSRLQSMLNSLAGEQVTAHIRLKLMQKAQGVDLASFDDPAFYERLENANREAGMRPVQILYATFSVLSSLISAVGFLILLSTIGWIAPLTILVLAAPSAIVNYVFRNRHFWYMRRHSKERRQMNYYADVVTGKDYAKEMRMMDLSPTFIGKFRATFRVYYRGLKRVVMQEAFWQILSALVSLAAEAAVCFFVAYRTVGGGFGIGDYSLYAGALSSIGSVAGTIIASTATIYEGTLFIENVRTFLSEPVHIVARGPEALTPARHTPHTVSFEGVSFRYPGSDRDAIHRFDCTIRTGERVILVGVNGAGKTTLIKLLTRLYDPTEGRILLDGTDIRDYDPVALRALFGIIFQDFGRYALTVGENIALGNTHCPPDDRRMRQAAEAGDAAGFISDLSDGYDTPLMRWFEENGTELSTGQWQKLSVARAFYADADILILDEPTASLDAMAEQEIYDRIAELSQDKLVLFVSHRLSSATTADRILVLDDGSLVESGTHAELMARQGVYARLFTTQAKHYQTGTDAPPESPADAEPAR